MGRRLKLNLGCGTHRLAGWLNVDLSPACQPDLVYDLERTPWPWPDSSAEEMLFNHSLEHIGQDVRVFLAVIREIYRVARPGAVIRINAPHPRHDDFMNDPTHVRPITPQVLLKFDRARNLAHQAAGDANSPLGLYLDVDFEIFDVFTTLEEPYASQLREGALSAQAAAQLARERNNVIKEFRIQMRARKPG